ncbi:MAG: SPOR domain-containing protein [Candidatus Kapabacteria bacterium]|nr:SPOR domain-containing protein [Candidatus Kapabacteria bacterium]
MRKLIILVFSIFIIFSYLAQSQAERVRVYLKQISLGKMEEARKALPDLLADYPDDPAVMMLHGSVLEDINKSILIFERLVKKYPLNEFANDAWWKIIQYYALKGDTSKARQELENMKKNFPNSNYISPASDLVRTAVSLFKSGVKPIQTTKSNEETNQSDTQIKKSQTTQQNQIIEDEEDDKISYGLQVGVYSTMDAAKAEVERFKKLRLRAEIITKKIDKNTMYAVIIGDYATREAAEAAKNIVSPQCGCDPLIFVK